MFNPKRTPVGINTSFAPTNKRFILGADFEIMKIVHVLANNMESTRLKPKDNNHGMHMHAIEAASGLKFPSSMESGISAHAIRNTPTMMRIKKIGCDERMTRCAWQIPMKTEEPMHKSVMNPKKV
mmetsp:Transcript_2609/g.3436  ORF Transcript_2609/g.3436 Transcript_2609/m.3436 type:complete len:125 (+) Transcript_2609:796-1170(+)